MNWQIKNYKPANTGGAIAGRFTLMIGPMEVRGWTHFKGNDGSQWVSGPQREYEKEGERKFYPFVYFPSKEKWFKFQDWALAEIEKLVSATAASVQDETIPF